MNKEKKILVRKPPWLRRKLPTGPEYEQIRSLLKKDRLNTVCREAKCPNMWECFSKHTATFLIMGSYCTRNCRFCAVDHGPESKPDPGEPARVAEAALNMKLRYIVVTSVTRDDLPDGGASIFADTILKIKEKIPDALVEVLIPDFQGNEAALKAVLNTGPDVLNHNIETARRLYSKVRPEAIYERSLELIKRSRKYAPAIPTKSGLMLGLGETPEEIIETFKDLIDAGCKLLTLGQYLQPSKDHLAVQRFVPPEEFEELKNTALDMGFSEVVGGPFVRSSYRAKELFESSSG